jgi:hypothetical protein
MVVVYWIVYNVSGTLMPHNKHSCWGLLLRNALLKNFRFYTLSFCGHLPIAVLNLSKKFVSNQVSFNYDHASKFFTWWGAAVGILIDISNLNLKFRQCCKQKLKFIHKEILEIQVHWDSCNLIASTWECCFHFQRLMLSVCPHISKHAWWQLFSL